MKQNEGITKEDVLDVANQLNLDPTEAEIQTVIAEYNDEADADPTGYWRIWIESLLYNNDVKKKVK